VVNVFEYVDYRKYLSDYFAEKKKRSRFFSHRYFCNKLGLKSTNFMLLVIQGKRNISNELCFKISLTLRHSQLESAYFVNMVFFSQSKNYMEKNEYWDKMKELRQKTKFGKINDYQYDYYNNWYNIAVRELVTLMKKPIDFKKLAKLVKPQITATQARNSLKLLLKLGLLQETKDGYIQKDKVIRTDNSLNSLAVFNYHVKMSTIATEVLERYKREERNFSSCSMNLSEASYKKAVKHINELREKLMTLCEEEESPERVYHINFQLFPVSENVRK
jgi:uncharacterized protein (TIGR02147 family)